MLTKGYAALSADAPLVPFQFERRAPGRRDVQIAIEFCGICHSDIHFARNEWGMTIFPCLPGHEIIGRVAKVGDEVEIRSGLSGSEQIVVAGQQKVREGSQVEMTGGAR